jgi:uncharacterized membrane protein YadS
MTDISIDTLAPPQTVTMKGEMSVRETMSTKNPPPEADKPCLIQATTFLLTVALAAMGLEADVGKLRANGWKPLLVGAGPWLFISGCSLALIELAYH